MNIHHLFRVSSVALASVVLAGTIACGGSSNSDIEFAGTLSQIASNRTAQVLGDPIENVEVCALGKCSITDELGRWSFVVGDDDYFGGDVLFSFRGENLLATTVVPDLLSDTDIVLVDFVATAEDSVVVASMDEIDDETIEDEVDEFGEDIEDETDSAIDSIDEEISEL